MLPPIRSEPRHAFPGVHLHYSAARFTRLFLTVAATLWIVHILMHLVAVATGNDRLEVWVFDLGAEHNLPTLYSTVALLVVAGLLFVAARHSKSDRGYRCVLCFVFFSLACAETLAIHEQLTQPLHDRRGVPLRVGHSLRHRDLRLRSRLPAVPAALAAKDRIVVRDGRRRVRQWSHWHGDGGRRPGRAGWCEGMELLGRANGRGSARDDGRPLVPVRARRLHRLMPRRAHDPARRRSSASLGQPSVGTAGSSAGAAATLGAAPSGLGRAARRSRPATDRSGRRALLPGLRSRATRGPRPRGSGPPASRRRTSRPSFRPGGARRVPWTDPSRPRRGCSACGP